MATVYSEFREVADAFMSSGANPDGHDGNGNYIDCNKIDNTRVGICNGIVAQYTNDASGLAQIKVMGRNSTSPKTLSLAVGIIHPCNIQRLYPSDASGVVLCY